MNWVIEIFRENPMIPIFLTLGIGFWLGGLKFKSFSLGPVTATLIIGVIVGQMDIDIPEAVKSMAFLVFLFAIGYSVGPQFFRSLKGEGLKQILFAFVEAIIVIAVTVVICKLMGYNKGISTGVFAGAQTVSAVIGVGSDTIRSLGLSPEETQRYINLIPACYAVCYVFGTIGTAWIIANLGPVLLGGLKKVKAETALLEERMDSGDYVAAPGQFIANRPISFRCFKAESEFFNHPRTVNEIEKYIKKKKFIHYIERLRIKGEIMDPAPDLRVSRGDVLVLSGLRESIIDDTSWVGPEVTDHELLTFSSEYLPVTVSKSGCAGMTIRELRAKPYMHGVMISKLVRNGMPIQLRRGLELEAGDVVTLVGLPEHVSEAENQIGYSDHQGDETDMVFVGLGIAIGCFVGALVINIGGIPITLSTSGGAIIAGLILGWLRSKRPSYGRIPSAVTWFMNNAGLNIFIAVVGIQAGPTFIDGLQEVGFQLFFIGIACTTIPLIISIYVANKIFKFPAAISLGCVAGSRNAVAALGAIQDSLDSTLPMMGYTVTYAISSVLLILSGMVVTLLA